MTDLEYIIAKLKARVEALEAENIALKQENAELKHRLNKNSKNSSKPSSSDGLKKPACNQSLFFTICLTVLNVRMI